MVVTGVGSGPPSPVGVTRAGDGFDAVFIASYPRLVRTLTVICGDREVAADCVSDAFERAYVRWRRVGRLDDPVGWVRRVAINRAHDVSRRRKRGDAAIERLAGRVAPSEHDRHESPDAGLLAAVSGLSPQQRAVVALHYLDDLAVTDVASAMGLSEGTVKYHLHQARDRLRATWSPEEQSSP